MRLVLLLATVLQFSTATAAASPFCDAYGADLRMFFPAGAPVRVVTRMYEKPRGALEPPTPPRESGCGAYLEGLPPRTVSLVYGLTTADTPAEVVQQVREGFGKFVPGKSVVPEPRLGAEAFSYVLGPYGPEILYIYGHTAHVIVSFTLEAGKAPGNPSTISAAERDRARALVAKMLRDLQCNADICYLK